jgi:hypothetical protein
LELAHEVLAVIDAKIQAEKENIAALIANV